MLLTAKLGRRMDRDETNKLPRFSTLLDVHNELLLALLELGAFTVKLALRLCEGALVLAQSLGGGHRATKQGFLGHWLV